MLEGLFERLRLLVTLTDDEQKMESKELRAMMEAYKAEKEAELEQIAEAMDEMDYMEAMADSFQGGPEKGELE